MDSVSCCSHGNPQGPPLCLHHLPFVPSITINVFGDQRSVVVSVSGAAGRSDSKHFNKCDEAVRNLTEGRSVSDLWIDEQRLNIMWTFTQDERQFHPYDVQFKRQKKQFYWHLTFKIQSFLEV